MNFAITYTRSLFGIQAMPVSLEVHLSPGLPAFSLVGLPEAAVKESKDRVRSALINSQFEFPIRRITVNLAPANLPKSGCGFDLPMAIGILAASHQIPKKSLINYEFIGELALNGDLRPIPSIIPAILASQSTSRKLIIPADNAQEAALTGAQHVFIAQNIREICHHLCHEGLLQSLPALIIQQPTLNTIDWSEIKGQVHAKQALLVAASGGHNVLMYGPPGSGKTMLAKRFQTLLPDLSDHQALETAAIHAIRGRPLNYNTWRTPPFRAPHHTASAAALVGGGNPPKPGEISLATHGVLFLDELPEFNRNVLETLREPLESGQICISRAGIQIEYPAQFQLIAAMNPCPCGQSGSQQNRCVCSPDRINRYLNKLSDPFLDRIDIQINLHEIPQQELMHTAPSGTPQSPELKQQINEHQNVQFNRQGKLNTHLSPQQLEQYCILHKTEHAFLAKALHRLQLSARAYHRLLKVARTIADMERQEHITLLTLQQALALKQSLRRHQ